METTTLLVGLASVLHKKIPSQTMMLLLPSKSESRNRTITRLSSHVQSHASISTCTQVYRCNR